MKIFWIWLASVVCSFLAWLLLLGVPPATTLGWIGLAGAILLPSTAAAVLSKFASDSRHPFHSPNLSPIHLFALSWGSLAALMAIFMLAQGNLDLFIPCRPFGNVAESIAPGDGPVIWRRILAILIFIAAVGLAFGLFSRRHSGDLPKPGLTRLRLAAILAAVQIFAFGLAVDPAYLGYPAWSLWGTVERGRYVWEGKHSKDPTELLDDYLARSSGDREWPSAITFSLLRSRHAEFFIISIQLDEAQARLVSLRARRVSSPPASENQASPFLDYRTEILERRLGARQTRRLRALLGDLWRIEPTGLLGAGLDGSSWIFDGHHGGESKELVAWCPGNADYHDDPVSAPNFVVVNETGRALLRLSGFPVCEDLLY